jgi:flagellar FliJ protein
MKSRETLIRLRKFQVDEKRRRVAQIESMVADFDRMAADLDREIAGEQDKAGIHDPTHFAYPTYAKAALGRRDNLKRSADELKSQLEDARMALAEAFEELKKVELLDERRDAPRGDAHLTQGPDRSAQRRPYASFFWSSDASASVIF